MNADTPHFPETPPEALGPAIRETVLIDGHPFQIERPGDSDRLFEHPAIRSALATAEYLPCWADLWPASRMLAKAVLREPWPPSLTALELGCGLGLPGIAALARGLRVVFSDCDLTALRVARKNAELNGYSNFELLPLDWRCPPEGLTVPVLLASDLVYERRHVEPLAAAIAKLLAPDGICLLTDQDRPPAEYLREELLANALTFTMELMRAGEPGSRRFKGTLYKIRHRID